MLAEAPASQSQQLSLLFSDYYACSVNGMEDGRTEADIRDTATRLLEAVMDTQRADSLDTVRFAMNYTKTKTRYAHIELETRKERFN